MTNPLGALIVGAGDMGARHALGWKAAGAAVIGVYDPDGARAGHTAGLVGGRTFADLAEGLAHSDVDVVSVCTPTYLHADATVAALEAGHDVLCEKPAALELAGAFRMRAAERATGNRLRIGFMRRFDPLSQRIHEFCRRLDAPMLAQATIAAGIRPKLLMHDARANGGPIIDMCCHVFDQWSVLFGGQPHRVLAHGHTFGERKLELASVEHKALDSAFITLEYSSGGVGQIQVSWGLPRGIAATETHTYLGPDGIVTVAWPDRVTLHDGTGETSFTPPVTDAWQAEIQHFYRELIGRPAQPLATIDDGIDALRTSLAVLESVAAGTPISVGAITGGGMPEVAPRVEEASA